MANETMQWPNPGIGSVGSYQLSGIPYATASVLVPASSASPLKIEFPYVARTITVINTGSADPVSFKVGFSSNGIKGSNYFVLANGQSYSGDWRIEDIFLHSSTSAQSSASIIAELTPIPRGVPSFLTNGTGNNWSGSIGVG